MWQSPTLGVHTHVHAHGFWVGMGAMLFVHGWAWMGIGFVHPCIQLQIGVKLLGCRVYYYTLTKKRSGLKPTTMNNLLFVRSNQDLV